jgi:aspartyl protease family protein
MNGRPVEALIDTGASLVAINVSTARRLGFSPASLDFQHNVNTANGTIKAAHVVLDRVEIGSIRVREVDAFVLEDKALSSTLVGMSFMKKLKSYTAEDRKLRMIQ